MPVREQGLSYHYLFLPPSLSDPLSSSHSSFSLLGHLLGERMFKTMLNINRFNSELDLEMEGANVKASFGKDII